MRSIKTVFDGRELVLRLCAQYGILKYTQQIITLTFAIYSHLNKRHLRSVTVCIASSQRYWVDINTYKPDKINYQKFYLIALLVAEKFKIYRVRAAYRVFEVDTLTYREISSQVLKKRGKEIVRDLLPYPVRSTGR